MGVDYDALRRRADALRRTGPRGRYAPSPTGPLHLGNARTALIAWLHARLANGVFVMRMENLDRPRCKAGSADDILDDLHWMGLDWDEGDDIGGPLGPYIQSQRDVLYAEALAHLTAAGCVYACYCSRKDIRAASSAPHGALPVYPGTCRTLARPPARGSLSERVPAWRFCVDPGTVAFQDQIFGHYSQRLEREVGDFVLRRSDGLYAYQLAVAVDDALMGITDVVRGADLLDSTPRQIVLLTALDLPVPRYWHLPLLRDRRGERMSKRNGADSIREFRERGGSPAALVGRLAASLALIDKEEAVSTRELLQDYDGARLRSALIRAARREPGRVESIGDDL